MIQSMIIINYYPCIYVYFFWHVAENISSQAKWFQMTELSIKPTESIRIRWRQHVLMHDIFRRLRNHDSDADANVDKHWI